MGAKRAAISLTVGLLIGWIFKQPTYDSKSEGYVHSNLSSVKKLFDEILSQEREGIALAAYNDGELVVDLWGGYAERHAMRLWKNDTMTVAFSSTKVIGALIMAILVSRGHLSYDDLKNLELRTALNLRLPIQGLAKRPDGAVVELRESTVTKYWPEFGAHDKGNVTVRWIVEHKAGLLKFDGPLSMEQAKDHHYVSRLIENLLCQTKPMWPPGTKTGYHAITYGWLLDQLVRRADPEKRSLAQFYREVIQTRMKDADFYIGLPRDQHHRMARIEHPTPINFLKTMISNWRYLSFGIKFLLYGRNCPIYISCSYPPWMSVLTSANLYNNPEIREIENVAALGIGTARGLASAVATIIQEKLISKEVWALLRKPTGYIVDEVAIVDGYRGNGLWYEKHPTRPKSYLLMHAGHGMQNLLLDPETKTVVAIIRNGLSWSLDYLEVTKNLAAHILECIDR